MRREVAWRVFAKEYSDSDFQFSEGGERSPSYVVTPLGAKINRLFVVGVITDIDNVGSDDQPMWRAR
ncbi:MAG: DNA-binding protein, partial [Thermoplasmata archaeon]